MTPCAGSLRRATGIRIHTNPRPYQMWLFVTVRSPTPHLLLYCDLPPLKVDGCREHAREK